MESSHPKIWRLPSKDSWFRLPQRVDTTFDTLSEILALVEVPNAHVTVVVSGATSFGFWCRPGVVCFEMAFRDDNVGGSKRWTVGGSGVSTQNL